MSCIGPGASLSGGAWSCPPQGAEDHDTRACRRRRAGRRKSAGPGMYRSACRSSVQVTGQDRWDETSSARPKRRGKQWLRISLYSSITRSRPACHRSRPTACANRPVRQAWAGARARRWDRCHSAGSWTSRSRRAGPHLTAGSVRGTAANSGSAEPGCPGR